MAKIVIIGNGISGTTAALSIRERSDHDITMISDEGLQPFARTALMYIYMGHLKKEDTHLHPDLVWEEKRIERIHDSVTQVDTIQKCVLLNDGRTIQYDKLIIASGSKPNSIGCKGECLKGVRGLYHLKDLENVEEMSIGLKRAVVVGGGLTGVEMTEMFRSRGIPVTFLVREGSLCRHLLPIEESHMVTNHLIEHGIDLRLNTEISEINGDADGRVCSVTDSQGNQIECGFVGKTTGVRPNFPAFHPEGVVSTNRGILVDDYLGSTCTDIYAIGDCAELRHPGAGRKSIEAVWYTGKKMGQAVAKTVAGQPTPYRPGLWFNSAKFFDIEHQQYGFVPLVEDKETGSLLWEHPSGKKSIRICFDLSEKKPVLGFNLMGIRYRQEVCEKWLKEKTPLEAILQNLDKANFDPEFFATYEDELVAKYINLYKPEVDWRKERRKSMLQRLFYPFANNKR